MQCNHRKERRPLTLSPFSYPTDEAEEINVPLYLQTERDCRKGKDHCFLLFAIPIPKKRVEKGEYTSGKPHLLPLLSLFPPSLYELMASLPFQPPPAAATITASNDHHLFLFNPRPSLTLLSLRPRPTPPSPPPFCSSSTPSPPLLAHVLIAPAECPSPAPPEFDLREELLRLRKLRDGLSRAGSVSKKLRVIRDDSRVQRFFADYGEGAFRALRKAGMGKEEVYLVQCLVAGGQEHVLGAWGSGHERFGGGSRIAVKTALYSLVGMIERLEVAGSGRLDVETREELEEEAEVGGFRRLLKVLREVESFYDCIGGIIG